MTEDKTPDNWYEITDYTSDTTLEQHNDDDITSKTTNETIQLTEDNTQKAPAQNTKDTETIQQIFDKYKNNTFQTLQPIKDNNIEPHIDQPENTEYNFIQSSSHIDFEINQPTKYVDKNQVSLQHKIHTTPEIRRRRRKNRNKKLKEKKI